jgi:hypothetical protein
MNGEGLPLRDIRRKAIFFLVLRDKLRVTGVYRLGEGQK